MSTPSRVPPKGTISVDLPGREPHTALRKEMEIRNGEVSFEVPIGREFSIEPAHTVGYSFERRINIKVNDGRGQLVIPVPVIPAGAIYAQARRANGSLAGNVSFSVAELKRSPLAEPGLYTMPNADNWSPDAGPRKYVASPLPLGGTYVVIAWQSNNFAISEPIKLTEEAPDRKVELQFRPGARIAGQVISPAGQPLAHAKVGLCWSHASCSFGMPARRTDYDGRFCFDDCNPRLGQYVLTVHSFGLRSASLPVNFSKLPLSARLEPGLRLSGRVIEAKSKRPVVSAEVRALPESGNFPNETARTDEQGRFVFDTLNAAKYHFYVEGCSFANSVIGPLFQAGAAQPVQFEMTLIPGASVRLGSEEP